MPTCLGVGRPRFDFQIGKQRRSPNENQNRPACLDVWEQFFVLGGAKWQSEKETFKRVVKQRLLATENQNMPACFDIGQQFFVFSGATWQSEKEKFKRSRHVLALEGRDLVLKSENRDY